MARILVTGSAGFIGFHVAARLLDRGDEVVGVDNVNDYYDVTLKEARLAQLAERSGWSFVRAELSDAAAVAELFATVRPDRVVHLAAQAGVRYSLENPAAYVQSNLVAFAHILEQCREHKVEHLVYASSSSVYGGNTRMPFSVSDAVDHPLSLYAATKKSNELMAHTYSHLFALPTTGLRFFTVYGPWGRPDMALFIFTKAILAGQKIRVFNHGDMRRDFTYVQDIVTGVIGTLDRPPGPDATWSSDAPNPGSSRAPYRVYNIGNSKPVELLRMIEVLEAELGAKAEMELLPMQPGDVPATYADVTALQRDIGYQPATSIEDGVRDFVAWYREFYG